MLLNSVQVGTCFSGRLGDLRKVTYFGELGSELGFPGSRSSVLFTRAKFEPCYSKCASLTSTIIIIWELVRIENCRSHPKLNQKLYFDEMPRWRMGIKSLRAGNLYSLWPLAYTLYQSQNKKRQQCKTHKIKVLHITKIFFWALMIVL